MSHSLPSHPDQAPNSPTQPLRSSSAFSQQIRMLKLNSEGINEEAESCSSSSTSSKSLEDMVSLYKVVDKETEQAAETTIKASKKSAEAEDAISHKSSTNSQTNGRFRTSSIGEDPKKPPIKGILRQSPYISKEDISQSNENIVHIFAFFNARKHWKRFHQSFYWFAHNHKKIGFRHFCMILLVLSYTLLGAALFYSIESKHEHETMQIHKRKLERVIYEIAQTLELEILDPMKLTNITQMEYFITRAYVKLLTAEDLYSGSTFYKHEDPKNLKWTYGSACFFSMNVYTTTGYGSIAPSSTFGKAMVIIYGLIFVPLTAVVIRDLGQWALLYLTKMYTILIDNFRRVRGFVDKFDEDEIMSLPIKFSVSVMILYLLSATMFIFEYDELSGPPGSGISFFHAFYFSFVSMSTIGLGDIMPNNVTFSPLITIMFFFGMPILKVVNRVTYICLENGVFGTMTVLENRLDTIWSKATVLPTAQMAPEQHIADVASRKHSMLSEGMIPDEILNSL
uniref:Potassium channel domain-containing protein n=1 Tax=Caenorhabditis japonica TaxID=281687 RepID=A0A8R1HQ90_CAEJA